MKHKIWTHHLISAILAAMLAVSAIGCLVSGHELPVASLVTVYLLCGVFALVSSLLLRFRYGGWGILGLFALALYVLLRKETLCQQTQSLIHILTSYYHDVYAWPVFGSAVAEDVSLPLILWAVVIAVCVNWYVCRRKHILLAFIPAIIPLVLCLITNDRVPSPIYLFLLILGLSLLLLTDWTRDQNPAQGMKLVFRSVIPMGAALALLFCLNPRETYVNHAGEIQKQVVSWFQELQDNTESVVNGTPVATPISDRLSLVSVGPRSRRDYAVMRVNSPIGGKVYLRGRDYDRYTGTGWEATAGRNEVFTAGRGSEGNLSIVTYGVRDVLYTPYYATEKINLTDGALENEDNLQRYSYYVSDAASGNSDAPGDRYTRLPRNTLQWAEELVEEITDGSISEEDIIHSIRNYVSNSAIYDLDTSRMSSQYADFAQWFLEESETGYCVHFATAATVLLRAAGIPARYVEGYMVYGAAGKEVVVSSLDAHAWAEYYDSESGAWQVLEATPADPEAEETEPSEVIPESEPEETQEEEEESGPAATDAEENPTKPTDSQNKVPGNTGTQNTNKKPLKIPGWLKTVLKCLLAVAVVPIQAYVRMSWKRKLWNRGMPNERTITRWRQTRYLAKLLKQDYPEELDDLAQKAKFSQHRIQPEELQRFDEYWQTLVHHVHSKPWYQRILLKWILAIQ